MKKTMLVSSLVLFSTLLGAASVNAAEAEPATSKGSITLVTDNGANTIIDPENPGENVTPGRPTNPEKPVGPENPLLPLDPEDGGITGNKGPLSIDFVSPFYFGEQPISSEKATYYAHVQSISEKDFKPGEILPSDKNIDGPYREVPNYVQVTDKRGVTSGWSLSVEQKDQFKVYDEKGNLVESAAPLEGAQLTIEQKGINSIMPKSSAPELASTAPTNLTIGAPVELIKQNENTGMGKWALYFGTDAKDENGVPVKNPELGEKKLNGREGVSLSIPASAIKLKDVKYQATLNWTLEDGVSNKPETPETPEETK